MPLSQTAKILCILGAAVAIIIVVGVVLKFKQIAEVGTKMDSEANEEKVVESHETMSQEDMTFNGKLDRNINGMHITGDLSQHMHKEDFKAKLKLQEISEYHGSVRIGIIIGGVLGIVLIGAAAGFRIVMYMNKRNVGAQSNGCPTDDNIEMESPNGGRRDMETNKEIKAKEMECNEKKLKCKKSDEYDESRQQINL